MFWQNMSKELLWDTRQLFDQIDTQFKQRSPGDGLGAQMAVSLTLDIAPLKDIT